MQTTEEYVEQVIQENRARFAADGLAIPEELSVYEQQFREEEIEADVLGSHVFVLLVKAGEKSRKN